MAKKLQILRGTTAQNDAYTGSIGELTMDTEKVEVRIHDGTTQGGKTIGSGGGASLPILTHVFSDHKLNDISWLNADTFSWQSGDVYVAAYEHLANDYNSLSTGVLYAWSYSGETYYTKTSTPSVGDQLFDETGTPAIVSNSYVNGEISVVFIYADGSITYARTDPNAMLGRDASKDVTLSAPQSETETISGITIRYYKADDGHKICMQDQEANVQALYEKTGVAWYYILDTANKQFKLPRTKFGFTGLRDEVGRYVEAGLPNITGTFSIVGDNKDTGWVSNVGGLSGAFYPITAKSGTQAYASVVTNTNTDTNKAGFNASRSSSVYGNSNTVQPKATQMYLYFYVGNFEREAIEQTAGITSEQLNNKADTDLSNLTSAGKEKLSIKSYSVTGEMFNALTDSVAGTGSARVYLMPYGKVIIDFVIRITTGGTSSSEFNCGLNRDLLRYLNNSIPVITPVGGTYAHYNTSGYLSQSKTGYGGNLAKAGQFWQFGRVYQTDGKTGGWPASNFAKDEYLVGTAWGTYEI